jgi:hypothetical protein
VQIDLTPTQQQFLLDCVQHYRRHCAGRLGFIRREEPIVRAANTPTLVDYLEILNQQESLNGAISVLYYLLKQAIERQSDEASANDDDDCEDDDDCGGLGNWEVAMAMSSAICDAWNQSVLDDMQEATGDQLSVEHSQFAVNESLNA